MRSIITPHQGEKNTSTQRPQRACHFYGLFISHNGDVFPCCITWMRPDMKIGHIDDGNIMASIRNFYNTCACERFRLRKASAGEKIDISLLNIELSLQCQGQCALCYIDDLSRNSTYDSYGALTKMVEMLQPKKILVQGGEVLIQKQSLAWLKAVKAHHPGIELSIVSNCNAGLDMLEEAERLFDEIWVSFMAFQPETYERVMGMNIEKTIRFVEALLKRGKKTVLKFLMTPLSIHEITLFLEWAFTVNPWLIYVEDACTDRYVNADTSDQFWKKIFQRTGQKVKTCLVHNKQKLLDSQTAVQFTNKSLRVLGLDNEWGSFLRKNGLQDKVTIFWM